MRRYSFGEMLDGQFLPSVGALLAGKYESKEAPLRIDFSIRAESLPTVSYVDVLRGDPAALSQAQGQESHHRRDRDRAWRPLQRAERPRHSGPPAADAGRGVDPAGPRAAHRLRASSTLGGLGLISLLMVMLWRRLAAGLRVVVLVGLAAAAELSAMLMQAELAVVLDTSFWHHGDRRLSRRHGARRNRLSQPAGRRRGKALPADRHVARRWPGVRRSERPDHGLEPGRRGDFRLRARGDDRPAARSDLRLGRRRRQSVPFSIRDLPLGALQVPGGKVMELEGRREERRGVSARSLFLPMAGRRRLPVRRGDARHLGAQARGRKNQIPGGARHADRPRQPQHAVRASRREACRGRKRSRPRSRCWCWTSTSSSRSTTRWATPAATSCSVRSPSG